MLGDGRKLFANQIFTKADAYFHRGNYPSIFDQVPKAEENHMASAAGHEEHETAEEHEAEHHQEGPPPTLDWIEALGQKFRASSHVHLEKGAEREMLPWLQLTAELDPHNIEAYTVAAYWLRDRLKKVDEAEQFLREGLRQNPNDPDILNELARLYLEDRKDLNRARNLWRLALRRWQEVEKPKEKPNELLHERILAGLVEAAVAAGHRNEAIDYLQQLKEISPVPEQVQKRIDELSATGTFGVPK